MASEEGCLSCLSNSGKKRISPGPPVHVGQHWQVEHACPSGLVGWLVIVLRRHTEALHDLTSAEFAEFGQVLERTVHTLQQAVGPLKEYVACYAEIEQFRHVHFHVVPRAHDIPEDRTGTRSFGYLKVAESEGASEAEIREFCEKARLIYEALP